MRSHPRKSKRYILRAFAPLIVIAAVVLILLWHSDRSTRVATAQSTISSDDSAPVASSRGIAIDGKPAPAFQAPREPLLLSPAQVETGIRLRLQRMDERQKAREVNERTRRIADQETGVIAEEHVPPREPPPPIAAEGLEQAAEQNQ